MRLTNRVDRISEMINELMETQEKYEVFLDANPWGILVVDQTFHIVYMNKRMELMSGWELPSVRGSHMHCLMPREDRDNHTNIERKYIKDPHERHGNHGARPSLWTRYGSIIPIDISIVPAKIHGKQFFFASIRRIDVEPTSEHWRNNEL